MEWHFEAACDIYPSMLHAELMSILHREGERDADFAAAELIFGELISNTIRYAPGSVTVKLDWSGDYPTLCVSDGLRGVDGLARIALPSDPLAESGRGLFIVKSLAKAFTTCEDGCAARATLPVKRRAAR